MYPNSPYATTHDEPTMTDLRGILPGQRPPIDATVLDEPTSEVPIIKPAGEPEPEPEPAVTEPEEQTAAAEPEAEAGSAVGDIVTDTEPEAAEAWAPSVPEAEAALDEEPEPTAEEATAEPVSPMATPPVVPAFGADARPAEPPLMGGEMAKMAWSPPAPPPGLVPTSPGSVFAPFPPPPVTEPEPVPSAEYTPLAPVVEITDPEPAPVSPAASMVETIDPEPADDVEPAFDTLVVEPVTEAPAAEPDLTEPAPVEATTTEPEVTATPEPEAISEPEPEPTEPAPAATAEPGRAPGEVAETPVSLWSDEAAARFRDQWRDLQIDFVDDPNAAVEGAKTLISEAVHELADTLLAAQDTLDPFHGGDRVDTEAMRVAMRSYREFLDRVLAL